MRTRKDGTDSRRFLSCQDFSFKLFKEGRSLRTELSSKKGGGIINRNKETALSV